MQPVSTFHQLLDTMNQETQANLHRSRNDTLNYFLSVRERHLHIIPQYEDELHAKMMKHCLEYPGWSWTDMSGKFMSSIVDEGLVYDILLNLVDAGYTIIYTDGCRYKSNRIYNHYLVAQSRLTISWHPEPAQYLDYYIRSKTICLQTGIYLIPEFTPTDALEEFQLGISTVRKLRKIEKT